MASAAKVSDPRGLKRICMNCGNRFYDLNKHPIICPSCNTEFTGDVKVKARRSKVVEEVAKEAPKAAPQDDDEEEIPSADAPILGDDDEDVVSLNDLDDGDSDDDLDDDLSDLHTEDDAPDTDADAEEEDMSTTIV